MSALGVGVRVRVGWCASEQMRGPDDPRLRAGTIIDGPSTPGIYQGADGEIFAVYNTSWRVSLDGGGDPWVAESLLTPLDDDGAATQHEDELEAVSA